VQGREDESMLVTDLEYADDAALCATTPKQLQTLIDCFVEYCDAHGLQVNPSKCEVVVFSKTSRACSWNIKGRQLPRSQKFKYLGVELHGTASIKGCIPHRLSCMMLPSQQSAVDCTSFGYPKTLRCWLICLILSQVLLVAMDVRFGPRLSWLTDGTYEIVLCNVTKQLCISKH
jgi:hypothetical protein